MSDPTLDPEAVERWRQAIRRDVASGYHYAMGNALLTQDDSNAAVACYRRALDVEPQHEGALHNLALALERNGADAEAVEIRAKLDCLGLNGASGFYGLGETLEGQSRYAEAEQAYRDALAASPTLAAAHLGLGMLLLRNHSYAEAAEALWQAHLNDPNIMDRVTLARKIFLAIDGLRGQGRHEEVVRQTERALSIMPDHIDGRMFLAQARFCLNQYDRRAALHAEQILALQPERMAGWLTLFDLRRKGETPYRALSAVRPAWRLSPGDAGLIEFFYARADALTKRMEDSDAGCGETHLLQLAEFNADLAVRLHQVGRKAEAIATMRNALTAQHPSCSTWRTLLVAWERGKKS